MWYLKLFEGNRDKIARSIHSGVDTINSVTEIFRGIGVKEQSWGAAIASNNLVDTKIDDFSLKLPRISSGLYENSQNRL